MKPIALCIIIPTLNERGTIESCLQALLPFAQRGAQIVVVDGASMDGTVALTQAAVKNLNGAQAIGSGRGRALQMNAGAAQTTADMLLFMHADTLLPPEADRLIVQALSTPSRVWGRFDVSISGQSPTLRMIAACMNLRSRWSGIATGDQAIFMTRQAFEAVGGFPLQPLMEDVEMSSRLLRLSRPVCLRPQVITSGRRWETRGVWRTVWLMWRLRLAYWWGVPSERLAHLYR